MTEINIKNEELISQLDNFIQEFYEIPGYSDNKYVMSSLPSDVPYTNSKQLMNQKYLYDQMELGFSHEGFPVHHYSQPIGNMAKISPDLFGDISFKIKKKFPEYLGVHSNALSNFYPPHGFVGWHTNWNANAYQVLFTWSKDGNGEFKYFDKKSQKIITIKDNPGWSARWYYFGRQDEPEHHCWHAAYTECDRFTFAYKFYNDKKGSDKDIQAFNMLNEFIYDIEGE